ncbi:MAG: hypothetical protein JWO92_1110 [Chitinophagaceae bacterium]|nr:hypothetical protein [Chitinophagaceae bacterium]
MKINFLPRLFMSYASSYGCGDTDAVHVCHDCPDGRVREFARTRSAGFIKKAALATVLAAPTTEATWTDGITAGDVIMCPETSGSFDPGTPKELKGFGNRKVSYGPRTMKLSFNDPDYAGNYAFYNEISGRTDLVPFYRTSSLVHIFDTEATVIASDPVADDLEEEIIWNVVCEVISQNLPTKHEIADIEAVFGCPTF